MPADLFVFLIVSGRIIPKATLSLHFKILREAGLIRSERHDIEMHDVSRYEELNKAFRD